MEISAKKTVQINAKTLRIHCKVSDRFTASLVDQDGKEIYSQDDGYVPDFMPGNHYGDYVILDIDMDTGKVTNWKDIDPEQVEEWIKGSEED